MSSTLVGNGKDNSGYSGGKNWDVGFFLSLNPRDADGRADDDDNQISGEVCLLTRILSFNNQYL